MRQAAFSVKAFALAGLCLAVDAALARVLRPTHVIRAGLKQLAANDLRRSSPTGHPVHHWQPRPVLDQFEISGAGDRGRLVVAFCLVGPSTRPLIRRSVDQRPIRFGARFPLRSLHHGSWHMNILKAAFYIESRDANAELGDLDPFDVWRSLKANQRECASQQLFLSEERTSSRGRHLKNLST
jgi:hypothetical protein